MQKPVSFKLPLQGLLSPSAHILTDIWFSGSNRAVHRPVHFVVPTFFELVIAKTSRANPACDHVAILHLRF